MTQYCYYFLTVIGQNKMQRYILASDFWVFFLLTKAGLKASEKCKL